MLTVGTVERARVDKIKIGVGASDCRGSRASAARTNEATAIEEVGGLVRRGKAKQALVGYTGQRSAIEDDAATGIGDRAVGDGAIQVERTQAGSGADCQSRTRIVQVTANRYGTTCVLQRRQ